MFQSINYFYEEFNFAIVIAIFITVMILIFFNRLYVAFSLVMATFFFKNLSFELISNIEIWKLSMLVFLISGLTVNSRWLNGLSYVMKETNFLYLWLIYTLLTSFVFTLMLVYIDGIGGSYIGFLNNEGRILTQGIYYLMVLSLLVSPLVTLCSINNVVNTLMWTAKGIVVLAFLGLFQKLAYDLSGIDIFPINRAGVFDAEAASLNNMYVSGVRRINSLAGEPKNFAIALVFCIGLIIFGIKYAFFSIWKWCGLLAVLLIALYYTYSTTGFILLVIMGLIYFFSGVKRLKYLFLKSLFLLPILAIIFAAWKYGEQDAVSFVVGKSDLEVQDESILEAILENPIIGIFGVGAGNIHQIAVNNLPSDFPLFKDKAYKPNSGFLFIISDSGVIGFILLSLGIFSLIRHAKRICEKNRGNSYETRLLLYLSDLLLMVFFMFLARFNEILFVVIGLLCATIIMVRRSMSTADNNYSRIE